MRLHRADRHRVRARSPAPRRSTSTRSPPAGLFLLHRADRRRQDQRPRRRLLRALRPGARCPRRAGRAPAQRPRRRGRRPEVVLEVTLRGRRLRVTRSARLGAAQAPRHRHDHGAGQGPGRGAGRPSGWVTLATRLDEAGHLLGGLLGLTPGQFCQVVLLPQGQFAEFLRADADRRRALLESLFDTARFAAVEGWLVDRRQRPRRELAVLDDAAVSCSRGWPRRVARSAPDGLVDALRRRRRATGSTPSSTRSRRRGGGRRRSRGSRSGSGRHRRGGDRR